MPSKLINTARRAALKRQDYFGASDDKSIQKIALKDAQRN
jgi:hypothetical protein